MLKKIASLLLFVLSCALGIGSTPTFAQAGSTSYVVDTNTDDAGSGDCTAATNNCSLRPVRMLA